MRKGTIGFSPQNSFGLGLKALCRFKEKILEDKKLKIMTGIVKQMGFVQDCVLILSFLGGPNKERELQAPSLCSLVG